MTGLNAVALGKAPAQLLFKNCSVIDVFTHSVFPGNIAIYEGLIAGIGDYTEAEEIIDLKGAYVAPGLINAHCHVESSMAIPQRYCEQELKWGVTTLITDPHEIANVAGTEGIKYMLAAGSSLPINYYVQLPSCVPATPFEHSGATLLAKDLEPLLELKGVLGLGEMMNVPGVLYEDHDVMAKLDLCRHKGLPIDGHSPCLGGRELQAYVAQGMATDHEAISWLEAKEKLRAGMAVLVREGSACHNLEAILQGVLAEGCNTSRLAFCTDDKHLAAMEAEGTIAHCLRKAVDLGMNPAEAVAMATINPARIYGLKGLGAVAPGYRADLVVFNNLVDFKPVAVFCRGEALEKALAKVQELPLPAALTSSVTLGSYSEDTFSLSHFAEDKEYPVIKMLPGEIFTERESILGRDLPAALKEGRVAILAVLERHKATGHVGLGLLAGYGIKNAAVGTTVAHDSHNLIIAGTSPALMYQAARELEKCQGGYTLIQEQDICTLPLEVAGLMSTLPQEQLISRLREIGERAHKAGVPVGIDPFISLSFMALPVIPKIRLTDMGVFDSQYFKFI